MVSRRIAAGAAAAAAARGPVRPDRNYNSNDNNYILKTIIV